MRVMIAIYLAAMLSCFAISACNNENYSGSNTSGPDRNSLSNAGSNSNSSMMNTSAMNSNANSSNTASVQDEFWTEAAQGRMAEVELGKLASQKAQNAEVRKFAQMMVTDHGKANAELKTLAAEKHLTLPTALSSEAQSKLTELQGLSGAEFDAAYVDAMVEDHEEDVAAFKAKAEGSSDPTVKEFAGKTLPTLQKHLEAITQIRSKMNR